MKLRIIICLCSMLLTCKIYPQNKGNIMEELLDVKIEKLSNQFAIYFTQKDAKAIGNLLHDDFKLFDPKLKWIEGKTNVVSILSEQFQNINL